MSLKTVLSLLMSLLLCSCSAFSPMKHSKKVHQYGRRVSSTKIQQVKDLRDFLSQISNEKRDRFIMASQVYEWQGGEFVAFSYRNIEWGQGEGPLSFKLDTQDIILQIETVKEFLLVRTFFGLLLKVRKDGVEIVQAGFPVGSFEFVDGVLHLYSKNGRGRFCDQEELKRPPSQRDPSCELIAEKLVID